MLKMLAIPVLFLLPGLLLMRILTRNRSLAFYLLSFAFSIPITSIVAFALAEFGLFSLPALLAAAAIVCAALAFIRPAGDLSLAAFDQRFCAVLLLLLQGAFFYYRPPFEYYFGGRDPGIYVVNGIRIARTGSFLGEDPLIRKIPREALSLFLERRNPVRYMGFSMKDASDPRMIPNFFYLYPVWIAIFFLLLGVHGCLYATPFLACCVLLIVALFARLLVGKWESVAAVLLLGTSTPFLWFSRFPNSELLASFLAFCGIFCFELLRTRDARTIRLQAGEIGSRIAATNLVIGLTGAAALAISFGARVDALLLSAPFVLYMVSRWIQGAFRKTDWWICAGYLFFLGLGFLHVRFTDPLYLQAAFFNLKFKPVKVILAATALAILIAATAIVGRRVRLLEKRWIGPSLAAGLAILLFYAYFIRPYYPMSNVGSPNAEAFLAIGWYFTHPVVLLAVAGYVLYARRISSLNWVLFASVFVYAFLYFYRIRGHAEHFWMLRRYLMVIFPAIAVFSIYAARELLGALKKDRPEVILLLAALLSGFFIYRDLPVHRHKEFAGSYGFIESLSRKMAPQDLMLIGSKEANDLHIIGPLLSYYFDRNVLVLLSSRPDLPKLNAFLKTWKGRVFFLGAGNTNLASTDFSLQPTEEIHFDTPVFDETYHRRPTSVLSKYFQIGLYRLVPGPSRDAYAVDVGGYDDGNITNFYLKEKYSKNSYRWTNGEGHVFFPPTTHHIKNIVLQMNPGPWVPGMERMRAKLLLNGRALVDLELRNGYNSYEVSVPEGVQEAIKGEPIDLLIESKSWVPKRVLDLPDYRRIGVIVDWVKLNLD